MAEQKHSIKEELRRKIIMRRKEMHCGEAEGKSKAIVAHLVSFEPFRKAEHRLFYSSKGNEVCLREIIAHSLEKKGTVLLPTLNQEKLDIYSISDLKEDLLEGVFGIMEPDKDKCKIFDKREIDLVIVPGVVFDAAGNRLGHGQGFYDRFLQDIKVPKIGLAYEFQMVDSLSPEKHDIPVDFIITEKRIIQCDAGGGIDNGKVEAENENQ